MFSVQIHRYIFLFGIFGLAFGMMIGTVPTSVPQIILICNWLLEGNLKNKLQQLKNNRLFWILGSVFLVHVFGTFYSHDLVAAGNDLRTKMPMFALPLILLSTPFISKKEFNVLLLCFLAGCIANTGWCLTYTHILHQNELVRNASRFMSHIRLGLYLNVAISCCVYFAFKYPKYYARIGFTLLALYFVFSMYALGLVSGMVYFVVLVFAFFCYVIYFQRAFVKLSLSIVLIGFLFFVVNYIYNIKKEQLDVPPTPNNIITEKTPWGKPYIHFDTLGQKENGNYVLINIQLEELKREWARRFPSDSFSYNPEHNIHRYEVLVRYLASKGLNKDSVAVVSLSDEDCANIQKHIYNYKLPTWSFLHRRVYEAVNEYDEFSNGADVNGHSVTMRFYFWKAALYIIRHNIIFGVGTGDVQDALNEAYRDTHSPLKEYWYKRPHNQFLTIGVALGMLGLFTFIFSLVYPLLTLKKYLSKIYWPFFFIALVSFLVEDTLETQAGLTFFAFFNSVFLTKAHTEKNTIEKSS